MKEIRLEDVEMRLRAEARGIRARDGFSRLLHERCMAALRREGLRGAEAMLARHWSVGRVAAAAGVAAAVAVGMWLVVRTPERPETPGQQIAIPAKSQVPENIVSGIDRNMTESTTGALAERKYAYLDRDARKLFVFVADQFPEFLPDTGNKAPANGEPASK
jgi:hypothetical protein